ncbi:MAG: hypothetical protein WCO84_06080 [bacterium]
MKTQILHMVCTEYELFNENTDPSKYYVFDTEQDARIWFETWYKHRRNNRKYLAQSMPLPGKDKFKIIEYTPLIKDNTYTVLKIAPDF